MMKFEVLEELRLFFDFSVKNCKVHGCIKARTYIQDIKTSSTCNVLQPQANYPPVDSGVLLLIVVDAPHTVLIRSIFYDCLRSKGTYSHFPFKQDAVCNCLHLSRNSES